MTRTAEAKGAGRPHVVPGEQTVRIGPFYINASLAAWLREYAGQVGKGQGVCLREALRVYKRSRRTKAPANA